MVADYRKYLVFGLSFMLLVFVMAAGPLKPGHDSPLKERGMIVTGHELYKGFCASCHGEKGEGQKNGAPGKRAPQLSNPIWLSMVSDDFLKETIRSGRHGTDMPAFKENRLSDERVKELLAFMRHEWGAGREAMKLPNETVIPASGNAEKGKAKFMANCIACHGANGQGGIGLAFNNPGFIKSVAKDPKYLALITATGKKNEADPSKSMPAIALTGDEVADMIAFFQSWLPEAEKAQKKAAEEADAITKAFREKSPNLILKPEGEEGAAKADPAKKDGAAAPAAPAADAAKPADAAKADAKPDPAKAKQLISTNCFACHKVGAEGAGTIGPDLGKIGAKMDATAIADILKNGRAGTAMTAQAALKADEQKAVADYLATLK